MPFLYACGKCCLVLPDDMDIMHVASTQLSLASTALLCWLHARVGPPDPCLHSLWRANGDFLSLYTKFWSKPFFPCIYSAYKYYSLDPVSVSKNMSILSYNIILYNFLCYFFIPNLEAKRCSPQLMHVTDRLITIGVAKPRIRNNLN